MLLGGASAAPLLPHSARGQQPGAPTRRVGVLIGADQGAQGLPAVRQA
jgi:hypothetical protein